MTLTMQIIMGSAILVFCFVVHIGVVSAGMPVFRRIKRKLPFHHGMMLTNLAVFIVLTGHTVQIWTWAFLMYLSGYFPDFETTFYFAIVTYTTLGYGDIIPPEGFRIVASFASITGLLTFGISTAFLISALSRLNPKASSD